MNWYALYLIWCYRWEKNNQGKENLISGKKYICLFRTAKNTAGKEDELTPTQSDDTATLIYKDNTTNTD